MRKFGVPISLCLLAFLLTPALASTRILSDFTITNLEWYVTQSDGKWAHKRYSSVELYWGIFVDTDPVYTHEIGEDYYTYLPSQITVSRHYRTAPRWRSVSWRCHDEGSAPAHQCHYQHNQLQGQVEAWDYRYRLVITNPDSGQQLSWGSTFGVQ